MLTSNLFQGQIETSVARCFDLILNCGGDSRARTDDPLLAKQVLSQLSYTPIEREVVGPSGLEPPTSRLSVVRSSQLSYGPVNRCHSLLAYLARVGIAAAVHAKNMPPAYFLNACTL